MANINGTQSNDTLQGTENADLINGLGGNDFLAGGNGNDTLNGGFGIDSFDGGLGFDLVDYNYLNGVLNLDLSTGIARFSNTTLTETLIDIEAAIGSNGNDTLIGNSVDNQLFGSNGNDFIAGGSGNDTLNGGFGIDTFDGGQGFDLVDYNYLNGVVNLDLSTGIARFSNTTLTETLIDIEAVIGSNGNDTLIGNSVDNDFFGSNGDDILVGDRGDDRLFGENGNDTLNGGGNIFNSFEFDTLEGGLGADTFVLGDSTNAFYRGAGLATISDFFWSDGDTIQVFGSQSDYRVISVTGGVDILYQGDIIAFVEGASTIDVNPSSVAAGGDFVYV